MKLFLSLFISVFFISQSSFSQVTVSTKTVSFGSKIANQKDSIFVTLSNSANFPVTVGSLSSSDSVFSLRSEVASIPANSSGKVWIRIYALQNLTYSEKVFISIPTTFQTFTLSVSAIVNYSESIYSTTQNKWDSSLISALTAISASGHTALGYDVARDKMFETIDDYNNNDEIECVYTERVAHITGRGDAFTPNNFNTEHTWPQSKFSSNNPMVSDLFHLYPTDESANGSRSNYPFGEVSSVSATWNKSKYGTLATGGTGFEPWDGHKGNVARSMFYFIVRYKGLDSNFGGFYDLNMDTLFRKWNKLDPVDAHEKTRCNLIQQFQGNRNPFIDHPEFADRIYDFIASGNRSAFPKFSVSSTNLKIGAQNTGSSYSWWIHSGNTGTANLTISSVVSNNAKFVLENVPSAIAPATIDSFKVVYTPTSSIEVPTGYLTLTSNAGTFRINLNSSENGDFNNNGSSSGQTGGATQTGTTNSPSNLIFSTIQPTSFSISWSPASGYLNADNDYIVIVKTGSTPTTPSGSLSSATANSNFTSATSQLNSDGKLVYKGDATSVNLTGLSASTTYYISVYTVQGSTVYSTVLNGLNATSSTSGGGTGSNLIEEGFSGFVTIPPQTFPSLMNWTFSMGNPMAVYTSSPNFGGASPSLKLSATGHQIITPDFENPYQLSFWYKGQGTDQNSALLVEEFNIQTQTWITLTNVKPLNTAGINVTFTLQLTTTKLRFTYTKSAGNLAFDDVKITQGVLPVKLSSFTVQSVGSGAKLLWSTATETNNYGFNIEKSSDDIAFSKIGFVSGKGTTTVPQNYSFIDAGQINSCWYRLKQIDNDSNFTYSDTAYFSGNSSNIESLNGNKSFQLLGNYPNPFNPGTVISYQLEVVSQVELKIFDLLGREIVTLENKQKQPGKYDISFDASELTAGIYIYQLRAGNRIETRKMLLVK